MTPYRRAPQGPFWVVGAPSAKGYCSSPSTLSRECLSLSSGYRVLGGTIHLPEHSLPGTLVRILREPSARGLLHAAPSTLSRNLALLVVRGLGCSRVTVHFPEHFLPGTWISWIIGELGYRGPPTVAPSTFSRDLISSHPAGGTSKDGDMWRTAGLASGLRDPRFLIHRQGHLCN